MQVKVNGKPQQTTCRTLHELLGTLPNAETELVVIINGYQTAADMPLKANDEIIWFHKNAPPAADLLEQMLAARHTPGIHTKLKQARVAVAGLGGLGSLVALSLARSGVGFLHLIDFDIVEPTNLNRQQYRLNHLGQFKAEALAGEIADINPFITVTPVCERATAENAVELFKDDDIVCECFDAPEAKAMLVNSLLTMHPDKFLVAASGMAGYGDSNAITTRRIRDNFYLCGDGVTAAAPGCGLMAPRVAICAGHQANLILQLIIDQGPSTLDHDGC